MNMKLGLTDSSRPLFADVTCDTDHLRLRATVVMVVDMAVEGTRAEVERRLRALAECGTVKTTYPPDWQDAK